MTSTTSEHAGPSLQTWETPPALIRQLEEEIGRPFALDACASAENAKAKRFYTTELDGLHNAWATHTFANPPYRKQGEWLAKAALEAMRGIESCVLVRASTSALYWRPLVMERAVCDLFEGRIAFINPATGAPQPGTSFASALCWFGPHVVPGVVRMRSSKTWKLLPLRGIE